MIEAAEVVEKTEPVATTPKKAKASSSMADAGNKSRGPNVTPKQEMHVGRDWSHAQWAQAFTAQCKKWDRANYSRNKS